jgi:thiol-disulfide isomerase/thioredoxin
VAALEPGSRFPRVSLLDENGASSAVPPGETLYAVFKTTCPVCEMTWPYLERLRQFAEGGSMQVLAITQDDASRTAAFNERVGSRIPTLYDPQPWKASDALGVTTVPTLFRVSPDGRIAQTVVGFDREALRDLARRAASSAGKPPADLFRPDEDVPAFKPG